MVTTQPGPLLRLCNVHVHYGEIHALRGVDLEVHSGEVVVLLGPNGAGKSTTINTIIGLVKPSQGTIHFKGTDITSIPASRIARKGIGLCPEGRRVFANMTVRENLQVGAYARTDKNRIAKDMDEMFKRFPPLQRRQEQLAGTMSGGEQQMLAIARALMGRPSLLLMDEPSLGMAPVIIDALAAAIHGIQTEGTTVLLVEQNAELALRLASRGYVLSLGEVALAGTRDELRSSRELSHAYLGGEAG